MYRTIAALLAAASCASLAQAQDLPSAGSTTASLALDDAVAAAGGSAPAADAARAGIDSARAARTVAGLRPNPTVQTQVENIGGTGVYRQFDTSQTTVSLGIPIELGGKRSARIAVANAQTDRALLTAAITQADIRLQVTQLYIEAVAAERRATNAAEQLRIAKDTAGAARIRVQAGRASPIEEQRAGVAQANAEAGVERAMRLADAARTNLARRIARPVSGPLNATWLESLPTKAYGPLEPINATGTLALAAADADLAVADAGVRLARSQRVPDLNVGPGVRHIAPGDVAFVVTFSMPIPVFNSGSAAVSQASAQRVQAEAQKRMTTLDMEQAITDAQAEEANAATTARTANGPALAAAQEAARIARIGYREGKFGQFDLLDAERTLADTRIAAIDALAAYQNAKARLERLTAPAPEQGN